MEFKGKNFIFIIFLISIIIFIISLSFSFIIFLNRSEYNISLKENINLEIKKIVLVGDSRMYFIYKSKNELDVPQSIIFNSKSGAKFDWFYDYGISNLYKNISNKNYKYYVVFNLGVNDLFYEKDFEKISDSYFKMYKNIVNNNKDIEFYFLSVNPIDDDISIKKYGEDTLRTNKKISKFNELIKSKIEKLNLNNFKYCDSNNSLDFVIPDGIHYDFDTNKNILNYIINGCIKINKNYYYSSI